MVRRRLHEMQALALRMGVRDDRAPGPQGGASPFCFSHRPNRENFRIVGMLQAVQQAYAAFAWMAVR